MLTLVVITHNEQDWIENCLASVKSIADELVVVDDGSADKTVELAKKAGAAVYQHKWEGFSKQKNFALTKVESDWVFFIDADERVSKELAKEIANELENPSAEAFAIPRQNIFLGKKVRHGGWWPDYVTRLVKKDTNTAWEGDLHETLKTSGEVKKLRGVLYHLSHRGITWMLTTSITYTEIEARLRFEANHPKVTWWRLFRVMVTEFWDRFFVKAGWRDGMVGVIESISQAYNMFLIYVHLWEMQQDKPMMQTYTDIDKKLAANGF